MMLLLNLAYAGDAPPDTDIFVADLDLAKGTVGTPTNVTARPGYDNQPAFLPDGSGIVYVSDTFGATEVYRYTFASKTATRLTTTPQAEFSPTPFADGTGFSAVVVGSPDAEVEAYTESQTLWRYGWDGTPVENLLPKQTRIGYHVWVDTTHIGIVRVGPNGEAPNALLVVDRTTGVAQTVAPNAGRSLVSDGKSVYFVDKRDSADWTVSTAAGPLTSTPPNTPGEDESARSEDFRLLPDGSLLMAHGARLLRWKPGGIWETYATLEGLGGDIKRMAISPDGKRIAVVVQRVTPSPLP